MKKIILQCGIIMIIALTIVVIFATCSYKAAKKGIYLTIYEKPYNTSDIFMIGDTELAIQYGLYGVDHIYGKSNFYDGIIYDPDLNEEAIIDRLQINGITIFIWWMLLSTLIYVIYKAKLIIKSKYIKESQNEN